MRNFLPLLIAFFAIQFSYSQYEGYSSDSWNKQVKAEEIFSKKIDKSSFKKHLKKLTERPHVVGSEEMLKSSDTSDRLWMMQVSK